MKICRYFRNRIGVVDGDEIIDVSPVLEKLPGFHWPFPLGDLFIEQLPELMPLIRALCQDGRRLPLSSVHLQSPVANPSKIIAIGRSYDGHIEEAKADRGINHGNSEIPMDRIRMLMKANSSLVGPGDGVKLRFLGRRTDPELEFAIVIGKLARNVSAESALDYVAGYTMGLDITLRGPELPSHRKSIDGYSVLGPWLVTPDEIADPQNVEFQLSVNDKPVQNANTRLLRFPITEIIANASRHYDLYPGDIIMTGTPEGVGPIYPGDRLRAWAEGIGTMDVATEAFS